MQAAILPDLLRFRSRERSLSELDDIDQLVRQHRARLLRFVAFSIGDADLAETIVQDCFLKAYNARDRFRGDCSVQTWLNGIALNLVRDQQRTRKFQFWRKVHKTSVDITDVASTLPSAHSSPESNMLARERAAAVASFLEELSSIQRAVFLMRFQDEMEIAEISVAMNMPVNTVKTHLHRAVKAVREKLGGPR